LLFVRVSFKPKNRSAAEPGDNAMRRFIVYVPFVLIIVTTAATAEVSTTAKIEADLQAGRISYESSLLYKAYSLFEPSRLPPTYRSPDVARKSGTPIIMELKSNWELLSVSAREYLEPYLSRPVPGEQVITPSGKFVVHYYTSGGDAVDPSDQDRNGIPDYIDTVAAIFDSCYTLIVKDLGYKEPPSDGTRGGGPEFDVYVRDLSGRRVYGYTTPERPVPPGFAYTSFIEVDNDYQDPIYRSSRGLDALRVTAAHEFFHAVQFSYYAGDDARWWMEISSTWMEDVAYDEVNDYYAYLGYFFNYPGTSLDVLNDQHEYGASIFAHYLAKRFGADTIRRIWEKIGQEGNAEMGIFDEIIPGGLAEAMSEFAIWNYYTGSRADPVRYYPEGEFYPEISVTAIHNSYPASGSGKVDHLASNYIRLIPQRTAGGLKVNPQGERGQWTYQLVTFPRREEVPDPTEIMDWDRYQDIVLVLTVTSFRGKGFRYSYWAEFDSDLTEKPLPLVAVLKQNRPNPFLPGQTGGTTIPFDLTKPGDVVIAIYSLNGQLVKREELNRLDGGSNSYYWDGRNQKGRPVASGVYFYRIQIHSDSQTDDFTAVRKMSLVR